MSSIEEAVTTNVEVLLKRSEIEDLRENKTPSPDRLVLDIESSLDGTFELGVHLRSGNKILSERKLLTRTEDYDVLMKWYNFVFDEIQTDGFVAVITPDNRIDYFNRNWNGKKIARVYGLGFAPMGIPYPLTSKF